MPDRGTLDNSKANRLLNFKPKYQLKKVLKTILIGTKNFGLVLKLIKNYDWSIRHWFK